MPPGRTPRDGGRAKPRKSGSRKPLDPEQGRTVDFRNTAEYRVLPCDILGPFSVATAPGAVTTEAPQWRRLVRLLTETGSLWPPGCDVGVAGGEAVFQTRTFRGKRNLRRADGLGKSPIDPPRIPAGDGRAMTLACAKLRACDGQPSSLKLVVGYMATRRPKTRANEEEQPRRCAGADRGA